MKRILFFVLTIALVLPSAASAAGTVYGGGVTVDKVTLISELLSKPDAYVGKTVKITGLVADVCTARGCWLEIAGDRPYELVRVKVEDGVIVFPASARGRQAAVQGIVEVLRMCPDEALRFRREEARNKGVPFDRASITGKEAALAIRATGAVIE